MSKPETIKIDEVEYVRKDCAVPPNGKRAVVVVDRGWIFAGDVELESNKQIRIRRAVWVFNWSGCGFDGVLNNPNSDKVNIRKLNHEVLVPVDAIVFQVPVTNDWGL